MRSTIKLEIHFYQQDEVALFYESNVTDPEYEQFVELMSFCLLAIRQIGNLGPCQYTQALGTFLRSMSTVDVMRIAVGTDNTVPAPFSIIPFRGAHGRKCFFTETTIADEGIQFKLSTKGFGFLGRGIPFYAPGSVMAALLFYGQRRAKDDHYLALLAGASELVGLAESRSLIQLTGQAELAFNIALGAQTLAKNAMSRES
jgi:hypothetical protein